MDASIAGSFLAPDETNLSNKRPGIEGERHEPCSNRSFRAGTRYGDPGQHVRILSLPGLKLP